MKNSTSTFLAGFLFLFFGTFLPAAAQEAPDYDSVYIQKIENELLIKAHFNTKINELRFDQEKGAESVVYLPGPSLNAGFGFNYRKIGLSVSFGLPVSQEVEDQYGKTDVYDLSLQVFNPRFALNAGFQTLKGLYMAEPRKKGLPDGAPYPQRKDMHVRTTVVSGFYIFNHRKYSIRAPFLQNEIQKKSAGSFLGGFYSSMFHLQTDTAAVPDEKRAILGDAGQLNRAYYLNAGISAGYAHTFVFGKKQGMYLSLSFLPGFGWQRRSLRAESFGEKNVNGFGADTQSRFAFGYTGKRFFGNLNAVITNRYLHTADEDFSIVYSNGNVQLTMGYRFDLKKGKS